MATLHRLVESSARLAPSLRRVRFVYSDLDGTLLGPGGSIFTAPGGDLTLEVAQALLAALDAGLEIIPVSGRNKWQLLDDVRLLGLRDYIAEAGCLIVHDRLATQIPVLDGYQEGGSVFEGISRSGAIERLTEAFPDRIEAHTPWNGNRDCSHILRGNVDVQAANQLLAELKPDVRLVDNGIIHPRVHTLDPSIEQIHAYHLLPAGASKARALVRDLELRGAEPREAIAIGDSASDLQLAEAVGSFFLVRNATRDKAVLQSASELRNTYVTEKEMGLGWAEVIREVLGALDSKRP